MYWERSSQHLCPAKVKLWVRSITAGLKFGGGWGGLRLYSSSFLPLGTLLVPLLSLSRRPCYLPQHFLQELNHSHLIFSARYLLIDVSVHYVSLYKPGKWKPKLSPYGEVCTHSPVILVLEVPKWIKWILQLCFLNYLKTRSHMECINNRSALSCFELLPFYHHCIITLWGFLLYH